jgi:hypothetical protein
MNRPIAVLVALVLLLAVGVPAFGASPDEVADALFAAIRSGDETAFARDFTLPLRKTLPPSAIAQLLRQLKSQAGRLVSTGKPQWTAKNTAIYALQFEKDELNLQLSFEGGKVGGIYLTPGGKPADSALVERAAANIEAALRNDDPVLFVRDFAPELSRALPKAAAVELFRDLREKYGSLETRGAISRPQPRLAVYPMKFTKRTLNLVLTVGADGKIQGIHFAPHQS